jgi:hypothetical protein
MDHKSRRAIVRMMAVPSQANPFSVSPVHRSHPRGDRGAEGEWGRPWR